MRKKLNRKNSSSARTVEELKKIQRNSFIKLSAMCIILSAILLFYSVAWFTMNREDNISGMGMKSSDKPYDIVVLENGSDGIYKRYHDLVMSDGAAVWQMTETDNMDNYDDKKSVGIKPGSCGMVSFYVKPRDASVNIDLTFEIAGYNYSETLDSESDKMKPEMNQVDTVFQQCLTGHILLFQKRTEVTDTNGNKSYVYSEPILLEENGKKRVKRTFTKSNENDKVNIYWVWPDTLSTLVDAREKEYVSTKPFCKDEDYKAVVNNIIKYPDYYFYNYSAINGSENGEEENPTVLTEQIIASQYEIYGDLYNRADNEIGMNINYITLNMATALSESDGE